MFLALEDVYRVIDAKLYGKRPLGEFFMRSQAPSRRRGLMASGALLAIDREEALGCSAAGNTCVWVEYEGLPTWQLEDAVRRRLGHPGATVLVHVWALKAPHEPVLAFEGHLALEHRSLSRSVAMCAAKLPALLRTGLARYVAGAGRASPAAPSAVPQRSAVRQIGRLGAAVANRLLWREQWHIEIGRVPDGGQHEPGNRRAVIRPPASAFWADPFLLIRGHRRWLIFEELPFRSAKGHISALEIDAEGLALSRPRVVLSCPWHLSYPFLWHAEGRTYMIPESSANLTLDLYECVGDEPTEWVHRASLMEGARWADATVVSYGGRLWMFATCGDEGASMNDELHVYWADAIEGPWRPHPLNPVKIDARTSRPAGGAWVQDGVLYRVVQDCSTVYGGSVRCMRVARLDEHGFAEEEVVDWAPASARQALPWHTFNREGNTTVVDRLERRPRWLTG